MVGAGASVGCFGRDWGRGVSVGTGGGVGYEDHGCGSELDGVMADASLNVGVGLVVECVVDGSLVDLECFFEFLTDDGCGLDESLLHGCGIFLCGICWLRLKSAGGDYSGVCLGDYSVMGGAAFFIRRVARMMLRAAMTVRTVAVDAMRMRRRVEEMAKSMVATRWRRLKLSQRVMRMDFRVFIFSGFNGLYVVPGRGVEPLVFGVPPRLPDLWPGGPSRMAEPVFFLQ